MPHSESTNKCRCM